MVTLEEEIEKNDLGGTFLGENLDSLPSSLAVIMSMLTYIVKKLSVLFNFQFVGLKLLFGPLNLIFFNGHFFLKGIYPHISFSYLPGQPVSVV